MNDKKKSLNNLKEEVQLTLEMFKSFDLKNDQYCVMPFVNLTLEPNGDISGCRHKGTEFIFGNIKNNTIKEIWTSSRMQEWRREFAEGRPSICKNELLDVRCNLCPELNKLLPYANRDNIEFPKILRLTANLNGKCNLECQMCHVWKMPNGFYNDENFWIPARNTLFKDVKQVDMLSGEPFIQKDTYRLIEEISLVNQACEWSFTTNLHWKLTDTIKTYLDKIKIQSIIISIDSLDKKCFEKIRKKGDLDFALDNLDNLLNYEKSRLDSGKSSLGIRLNCLIQKDNWKEGYDIISFCIEKGIVPFVTFLYEPETFSLLTLDNHDKMEVLNFYFEHPLKKNIRYLSRVIKPLMRSLDKLDYVYYLEKFGKELYE